MKTSNVASKKEANVKSNQNVEFRRRFAGIQIFRKEELNKIKGGDDGIIIDKPVL